MVKLSNSLFTSFKKKIEYNKVVPGSGAFDWSDTRLTAAAVAIFVLSLISQSLVLLFIRGYYAASQTVKPLIFSIFSAALTITLAGILSNISHSNNV